jgi:hypothetical protein
MPITVECSCGKRMSVSNALAGKTIKCPACGDRMEVSAAPPSPGGRTPAKKRSAGPAIYISKGKIIALVSLAVGLALGLTFYFGPVRVWNQWENIGGKASDDVSNVITFGLQAYLSQQGAFDPMNAHGAPAIDGPVNFFRPTLVMSMPDKVRFFGKSTQGNFIGFYYPKTGEIEADVAYGGMTFAGAVDLAKATNQFHMTGRMANGFPQAEVNGNPIKILWPDKKDQ